MCERERTIRPSCSNLHVGDLCGELESHASPRVFIASRPKVAGLTAAASFFILSLNRCYSYFN